MDLYDLSSINTNCNINLPIVKKIINSSDEKIFVLNRANTLVFNLPTSDGIIRFKYYDMEYITAVKYGCLHIHIKLKPFPIYDTIWIEFCKAISHILEYKNISYTQPVNQRTKILPAPTVMKSKHYMIRKSNGTKVQSRHTTKPFRNYPRQLVTRVGHYRDYGDKKIFINEQIVPIVKINKARGIRIG